MKSRRFWVSIIIVAIFLSAFGSVLLGAEDANQGSELQTLQAKIDSLEKTIRTQQEHITRTEKTLSDVKKQLDEQIKENNRLLELCKKAGIDTTKEAGSASKPIGHIIYRDKERDEDWFNRMYKRFSDKIALLNGKFVELRTHPIKPIDESYVEVGTIVSMCSSHASGSIFWNRYYRVVSVIGDGEALINCTVESTVEANRKLETGRGDFIFHLCGYDRPLIDGQSLGKRDYLFICVGTYKYTTALGAKKTVQSFKVWEPKPLTKEQFAEAISSGFELVDYVERGGKTIEKPIR